MLKLDEERKLEKAEREALLQSDDEEEEEDETLGGFIVLSGDSEEESLDSRSTSRSTSTTRQTRNVSFLRSLQMETSSLWCREV